MAAHVRLQWLSDTVGSGDAWVIQEHVSVDDAMLHQIAQHDLRQSKACLTHVSIDAVIVADALLGKIKHHEGPMVASMERKEIHLILVGHLVLQSLQDFL